MCRVGARATTAEQFSALLDNGSDQEFLELNSQLLHTIRTKLNSDKVTVSAANKVYSSRDFAVGSEYAQSLRAHFGSELEQLDFAADPDGAARRINQWVSENTAAKIRRGLF